MVRHVPDSDELRSNFREGIASRVDNTPYLFFWGISDSAAVHDQLVATRKGSWDSGFSIVSRLLIERPEWLEDQGDYIGRNKDRILDFLSSPTSPPFSGTMRWSKNERTFLSAEFPSIKFDLIAPLSILEEHQSKHGNELRMAREIEKRRKEIEQCKSRIARLEREIEEISRRG